MRIRVDFTIDVPAGSLAALREAAAADTNEDARLFVKGDAQEYCLNYLGGLGVKVNLVRDAVLT